MKNLILAEVGYPAHGYDRLREGSAYLKRERISTKSMTMPLSYNRPIIVPFMVRPVISCNSAWKKNC